MTQTNLALYRLLVTMGANEAEAEAAASADVSQLVTKQDLKQQIAELKASVMIVTVSVMGAQTAIIGILLWITRGTR